MRLGFVTLGKAPNQGSIFQQANELCNSELPEESIFRLLHREGHRLFPDDAFADLYRTRGRNGVPPSILAVVMVLQRIEGLSDREAVERFTFDVRWKYAAGLDADYAPFVHTVLVDMRARLRESERPNRIFEVVLEVARKAGFVGRRRVLDSTALYDAVATQDTVTMIRSAIRSVLRLADAALATEVRGELTRDDDYDKAGKPQCDWDDEKAREQLVDALVRDAYAVLALLDGRPIDGELSQASALLATVVGQDIEESADGCFRIARGVAPDRVISTVDPEARHGHKTSAQGYDGYKGHVAIDPDSEIITATGVTAANVGDAAVAKELLDEALASPAEPAAPVEVFGDASYGSAELVEHIENAGATANVKVQPPAAKPGLFSQDRFQIDTHAGTATCPAGRLIELRRSKDGFQADFAPHCPTCPMRDQCTTSDRGRTLNVHPKHKTLFDSRNRQKAPEFKRNYKATRPKVERKIAHLMRRRHGGRRARLRGRLRIAQDFATLAAAANLCRIARLKAKLVQPVRP